MNGNEMPVTGTGEKATSSGSIPLAGTSLVRALGAVVALLLYTEKVGGSNPSVPTIFQNHGPVAAQLHFPAAPLDRVPGKRAQPDAGVQNIFQQHQPGG